MLSSRWTSNLFLAALCVACALGAHAAGSFQDLKLDAVRSALASQPSDEAASLILAAVPEAGAIHTIVWNTPAALDIHVAGACSLAPFTLDGGKRFVIDFKDAVLVTQPRRGGDNDSGLVSALRSSLYRFQPALESRLVFDLRTPSTFQVTNAQSSTQIVVRSIESSSYAPVCISVYWDNATQANPTNNQLASDLLALSTVPQQPAVMTIDNALLESLLRDDLSGLAEDSHAEKRPGLAQDLQAVAALQPNLNLGNVVRSGATGSITAPLVYSQLPDGEATTDDGAAGDEAMPEDGDETVEVVEAGDAVEEPAEETAAEEPLQEEPLPPPARDAAPDTSEANRTLSNIERALQAVGVLGGSEPPDTEAAASSAPLEFRAPSTIPPRAPAAPVAPPAPAWKGDPMDMPVNLDFREMPMVNVVSLLKTMAGINIIAGTQLSEQDTVSVNLEGVPLRKALETVLRINGLGLMEDDGIYRIVPYEEAIAAERITRVITIQDARAENISRVLTDVLVGSPESRTVTVTSNEDTGTIVISGPESKVTELMALAQQLDVAETVLPTVTEALKLNYAEPSELETLVGTMLTKDIGQVSADSRARFLVVTDVPAVVEQVRMLVNQLDMPVRQVAIDSMVVDATLTDEASTGIDWIISAVRKQSARDAALGNGINISDLQELSLETDLGVQDAAGLLTFGILNDSIDIRGVIQAEVRNQNGILLSNPVVLTVENKPATITIAQDIPYIEVQQTNAGGSQTNTEFKQVGTVLEVTPRVTHDNHIIVDVNGKESFTSGEFQGIPIEDKRTVESTIRVKDGQTIFIGGLRKNNNDKTIRKVPVLGDVPVLNFLFRQDVRQERVNELMIFLTCNVLPEEYPGLTPREELKYNEGAEMSSKPDAHFNQVDDYLHPAEMRDPLWKVRRTD